MEEIDEFLSYIKEELDYLNGCQEFFENASNAPPANDEDLVNQYQDLIVSENLNTSLEIYLHLRTPCVNIYK